LTNSQTDSSNTNENVKKSDSTDPPNSDIIDMMLSKQKSQTLDSESLILETQKRVWSALKKGYEYTGMIDESDLFLRTHVNSRIHMIVLYVDLVGSTQMTLELSEEKLAIIISSFAQEMSFVIKQHSGYVLKFVGDAVIGYFIAEENSLNVTDNVINCAKSMISVIEKGINPILNQYDYPDLMVKIGIDYGENIIVRYGSDEHESHVDLLGPSMNIAAKIQNLAKPNQILIGYDIYTRLHPLIKKDFVPIVWKDNEWKYRSRVTGEIYQVYEYDG
jgi:class 3 adenylate cyclase